jgi:acyl carrier protein
VNKQAPLTFSLMTAQEIEAGVRAVIAANSNYAAGAVKLNDTIDVYISSTMADRLARALARQFSLVDPTQMTNDLFVNINSVQDIIDKIKKYYHVAK